MDEKLPIISCICVTRGKVELLKRSLMCFFEQTYPNKELVLLYECHDGVSEEYMESLKSYSELTIIGAEISTTRNLGALRNIAISKAKGEYICQWDDDDWYHAGRLEFQYYATIKSGFKGSLLGSWIVYNSLSCQAYVSNIRLWEGSLFCSASLFKEYSYSNLAKGEDTNLVEILFSKGPLYVILNVPHLYIYNYHGSNTWEFPHWEFIFRSSVQLADEKSRDISDIMNNKYEVEDASILMDEIVGIKILSLNE